MLKALSLMLAPPLARHGLYYVRYMDDILVLAPTRWKLRAAVRVLQQVFADLRLAAQTVRHFGERLLRLHEQQRTAREGAVRLGDYVTRWLRWTRAGVGELDGSSLPGASAGQAEQAH